jgi:hypothetical protein
MPTTVSNPGRIGLTQIHGRVGFGIRVGQYLNGSGFEDFEHAFMDLGDGTLIEAEPGGARIRPLDEYTEAEIHWCDGIYSRVGQSLRPVIADEARKLAGTPYSFLDYDALVLHRFHVDTDGLRHYIGDTGHLICSQLVDTASTRGGYSIFRDNRWPGFVTPGDLYLQDLRLGVSDVLFW